MRKVLLLQLTGTSPPALTAAIDSLPTAEFEVLPLGIPERAAPESVSGPGEAVKPMLSSVPFDVMLLSAVAAGDQNLPDCLTLLEDLEPVLVRIPLVVLGDDSAQAADAIARGAQDYLTLSELESCQLSTTLHKAIARHIRGTRQVLDGSSLRQLVDVDGDGWLIVDPQGHILFANKAAEQMLGQPLSDLRGQNFGVPTDTGTMEIDIVRQTQHGPQTAILDVRVTEVMWHGQPAFLELLRDMTDYKQQIRGTRDAIRQRDQFLATLSHELRNPLAAVTSGTALLSSPGLDEATRARALELMTRQCRGMARLLDDLLDFSRVGRGRVELTRQQLRLAELVGECLATVQSRVADKQQTLNAEYADCEAVCCVDPDRMQQVIVNLLTNASKYTPPGGSLFVRLQSASDKVVLSVSDTGEGIPQQMRESIFEPFVQLRQSPGATDDGLGIGLALARRLAELHQGRLWADSDGPGRGSTFFLTLPTVAADCQTQSASDQFADDSQDGLPEAEPLKVVVVEDREPVRMMTCALLQAMGNLVYEAVDGRQGLDQVLQLKPDLALIDLGLPELTGHDVARQLRLTPQGQQLFLVAMSGQGEQKDKAMATQAGFNLHITKPVSRKLLEDVLLQARHRRDQNPVPV